MTDREKVIKGLECCAFYLHERQCRKCPYYPDYQDCRSLLIQNAKEILKAQQPRLLTLEEVVAHYSLPPVFPDDFGMQEDYYEDIQPLYFEFPHDKEDPWIVHWRGHAQVSRYLDEWRHSYNKKWRCWTSRPDEKVRAETPWADN